MNHKALFFTFKNPYPPTDGGKICSWATIKGIIKAGVQVDLAVLSYKEDPVKEDLYHEAEKIGVRKVIKYDIDATPSVFKLLQELPIKYPDRTWRFFDKNIAKKLSALIKKDRYDFIVFDHLSTAQYFWFLRREAIKLPITIYRSHNIESEIWDGLKQVSKNPILKMFLLQEVYKLRSFEKWFAKEVDFIWSLSPEDIREYQSWGVPQNKIFLIRSALVNVPQPAHLPNVPPKQIVLQHVGSLGWLPNLYSMQTFFKEVFPVLKRHFPNLQIKLAGKLSEHFDNREEGVYGLGFIDDIAKFMVESPFFFIPVYVGSGIRIKLLEALAYKRIVITTSKGAQGFEGEHGKHILIADEPNEWVSVIDWALRNWKEAVQLAEKGRSMVENIYSINSVADAIRKSLLNL